MEPASYPAITDCRHTKELSRAAIECQISSRTNQFETFTTGVRGLKVALTGRGLLTRERESLKPAVRGGERKRHVSVRDPDSRFRTIERGMVENVAIC